MERLLVINGCSHSAGSEIPGAGIGDGRECRDQSFGALLAAELNRTPVHLALPGGSNDWIHRVSTAWLADHKNQIDAGELDVMFLVHWTACERTEYRFTDNPYNHQFIDYDYDDYYKSFSIGTPAPTSGLPKTVFETFSKMFVDGTDYWSDNKIKNIVSLQSILKSNNCSYWFGNAFDTFVPTKTYNSLIKLIDTKYYPYLNDRDKSYYWMCKNAGFDNQDKTNKIWHLGKDAHEYYTKFLLEEIKNAKLDY